MLQDFIGKRSYAIVAAYDQEGSIVAALGGVIFHGEVIELVFPKTNPFVLGQKVTFHIDDRTGQEEFDINLRVYRSSVKAQVIRVDGASIQVKPVEYELKYSYKIAEKYTDGHYQYPPETRPLQKLAEADFSEPILFNEKEKDNKLGVLITKAPERPHTTVMAFLSSVEDDIYIISHDDSFKSGNIHRDASCVFAIDHRSTFLFEKAIEWNYTLVRGQFRTISKSNPKFSLIQAAFIEKNPWEYAFFTDKRVEMYQIKAQAIVCPDTVNS